MPSYQRRKRRLLQGICHPCHQPNPSPNKAVTKNSSSQLTVIDINSDEGVEEVEEDPDAELGKVTAVNLLTRY